MRSPGINGEGELRGQPANPGSPRKMAVKTVCVCVDERKALRGFDCLLSIQRLLNGRSTVESQSNGSRIAS